MKVRKLNVVKKIDEKQLPEYEEKGFLRVGKGGKLIPSKQTEADRPDAKVAELEAALAEKDVKIAELEAAVKKADK